MKKNIMIILSILIIIGTILSTRFIFYYYRVIDEKTIVTTATIIDSYHREAYSEPRTYAINGKIYIQTIFHPDVYRFTIETEYKGKKIVKKVNVKFDFFKKYNKGDIINITLIEQLRANNSITYEMNIE